MWWTKTWACDSVENGGGEGMGAGGGPGGLAWYTWWCTVCPKWHGGGQGAGGGGGGGGGAGWK